jgi:hypothetical protein
MTYDTEIVIVVRFLKHAVRKPDMTPRGSVITFTTLPGHHAHDPAGSPLHRAR